MVLESLRRFLIKPARETTNTVQTDINPQKAFEALNNGPLSDFEKNLLDLLESDFFDADENLSPQQQMQKNYAKMLKILQHANLQSTDITEVTRDFLAIQEWAGLIDGALATAITIHLNLCLGTLLQRVNNQAQKDLLQELLDQKSVGVFLATELGYGNNLISLQTRADYDHQTKTFRLHTPEASAQKFMPNTGAEKVPKLGIVLARLYCENQDCGIFPFLVRLRDHEGKPCSGIKITALGAKSGYSLDNAITSFENVQIPLDQGLLFPDGEITKSGEFKSKEPKIRKRFQSVIDRIQTGKICLTGFCAKGTMAAVFITAKYAHQRKTFAPFSADIPIYEYKNVRNSIALSLAKSIAINAFYRQAHNAYLERSLDNSISTTRYIAAAKVLCSYETQKVLLICREKLGAQGLFNANKISTFTNYIQGIITAEGDNEILLIKTAKEILLNEDYLSPKELVPNETIGIPKEVSQIFNCIASLERHLVQNLRTQLLRDKFSGMSKLESWNQHIQESIKLANVHNLRLCLDAFFKLLKNTLGENERQFFADFYVIFAMDFLQNNLETLLDQKIIELKEFQLISKINLLCLDRVTPSLLPFLEAQNISAELLRSPVVSDYVQSYSDYSGFKHAHC